MYLVLQAKPKYKTRDVRLHQHNLRSLCQASCLDRSSLFQSRAEDDNSVPTDCSIHLGSSLVSSRSHKKFISIILSLRTKTAGSSFHVEFDHDVECETFFIESETKCI